MKSVFPVLRGEIPAPEPGWYHSCVRSLPDGSLAILKVDFDAASVLKKRREAMAGSPPPTKLPAFPREMNGRIVRIIAEQAVLTRSFPLDGPYNSFDYSVLGRWVIVSHRCGPAEPNAQILTESGQRLEHKCFGDGVEHIQCDSSGNVWVCYFDEGVYGASQLAPSEVPYGVNGVNCFAPDGNLLWSYDQTGPYPHIDDCYAMNVAGEQVYICFYSDFPIARIGPHGIEKIWKNDFAGARLMSVQGKLLAFLGGYNLSSDVCTLLRLGDNESEMIGQIEIKLPAGETEVLERFVRANQINFFTANAWYQLHVRDFVNALGAGD